MQTKASNPKLKYLLVDGYNIIFAWKKLERIAVNSSIDHARVKLISILEEFGDYTKQNVILVFDAYKVGYGKEIVVMHNNLAVVYTKEKETADNYIERVNKVLATSYDVYVATSDTIEQIIVLGQGSNVISPKNLELQIKIMKKEINTIVEKKPVKNNMLIDNVDEKTADLLMKMRLGGSDNAPD